MTRTIDADEWERLRRRQENRAESILTAVLEEELAAVLAVGLRGVDEQRWFDALLLIWDLAGEQAARFTFRALADDGKAVREILPNWTNQVSRVVARAARQIADRSRDAVARTLSQAASTVLRETVEVLYRTELGASIPRLAAQQIVSATASAQHAAAELAAPDKTIIKFWRTVGDDRVRQSHADAEGQGKNLDELFEVGSDLLMYPGDPDGSPEETYNCRCFTDYGIFDTEPIRVSLA